MKITAQPSPNFNDRQHDVDMLVLHYTGMPTGQEALDRMCDPEAAVSAHYMVWENGHIVQLVGEDKRAWHAGISSWQGDSDLNSRSIGIEVVNGGHDWPRADGSLAPYPDEQIEAVIALCQGILERWTIPARRIVGHSDIAPVRKEDPGEHFPWPRLAAAGIGLWPNPGESTVDEACGPLSQIGYDTSDLEAAVTAFQRRWCPDAISGQADSETRRMIAAVLAAYKAV